MHGSGRAWPRTRSAAQKDAARNPQGLDRRAGTWHAEVESYFAKCARARTKSEKDEAVPGAGAGHRQYYARGARDAALTLRMGPLSPRPRWPARCEAWGGGASWFDRWPRSLAAGSASAVCRLHNNSNNNNNNNNNNNDASNNNRLRSSTDTPYDRLRGADKKQSLAWMQSFALLEMCMSSLCRGHASLLRIVLNLMDDPRRESVAWKFIWGEYYHFNNRRFICSTTMN